jgi:DNA-directed RNA polymerase specialized sigma24 family protein
VIAARKALNSARDQRRLKRGGGQVRTEAELVSEGGDEEALLAQVVGREPTPEFAAVVAESLRQRLDALPGDALRKIALLRLEGHSNDEIAQALGCTSRTVMRKIEVIRLLWSDAAPDAGGNGG